MKRNLEEGRLEGKGNDDEKRAITNKQHTKGVSMSMGKWASLSSSSGVATTA